MSKNSVVFFGNEKLATGITNVSPIIKDALISAGYQLEQIVTGPLSDLKHHSSKAAVLAAYGHIIPKHILEEFPLGIINIHPSLLPKYRGPSPIEQAILDGIDKTGVSIMKLSTGMDEGPIYKQKSLKLVGNETKEELTYKLHLLGSELLVEVLPEIISGSLKPRSQPHPDRASYTNKINKQDGIIDWNKSSEHIEREIRAFANWPKSQTNLGSIEVIITKAHSVPSSNKKSKPGGISINHETGQLIIECKDSALLIDELKPSGKNLMSAAEFIRGYKNRIT